MNKKLNSAPEADDGGKRSLAGRPPPLSHFRFRRWRARLAKGFYSDTDLKLKTNHFNLLYPFLANLCGNPDVKQCLLSKGWTISTIRLSTKQTFNRRRRRHRALARPLARNLSVSKSSKWFFRWFCCQMRSIRRNGEGCQATVVLRPPSGSFV